MSTIKCVNSRRMVFHYPPPFILQNPHRGQNETACWNPLRSGLYPRRYSTGRARRRQLSAHVRTLRSRRRRDCTCFDNATYISLLTFFVQFLTFLYAGDVGFVTYNYEQCIPLHIRGYQVEQAVFCKSAVCTGHL